MTNPESLTMLAPKGIRIGHVPGGIPEVTPEDIAGAMRHLDALESELLRVKYIGDKPHKLFASVLIWCMDQGWDLPKGETDKVAQQAIIDVVGHNRCPKCNGTKQVVIAEKIIICPHCNGSGTHYQKSDNQMYVDWAVKWLQRTEYAALQKVEEFV